MYFHYSITVDIQCYISVRGKTQWLDTYGIYKVVPPVSLVPT